jgi:hypothetical protein
MSKSARRRIRPDTRHETLLAIVCVMLLTSPMLSLAFPNNRPVSSNNFI